ncbi:Cleavage induced protein, partial [Phytophthora megakarya]
MLHAGETLFDVGLYHLDDVISPPPPNHGSARRALNVWIKTIRKGQDEDRYLVLGITLLPDLTGVFCSQFGSVLKGENPLSEDAWIIHELSFSAGGLVNEFSNPDTGIETVYDGTRMIACRIEEVERQFPGRTRMMSGDVSGAFHHIPLHAGQVCWYVTQLGVLVVDLCCPFEWRNSQAAYATAGAAINHLYSATTRPSWHYQPIDTTSNFEGK